MAYKFACPDCGGRTLVAVRYRTGLPIKRSCRTCRSEWWYLIQNKQWIRIEVSVDQPIKTKPAETTGTMMDVVLGKLGAVP